MKLSDAISTIEQYQALRKAAGNAAWATMDLKGRVGWSRFPCSVEVSEERDNLIVTFYDSVEGHQSKEIVITTEMLEKF